jgi:FkbM family methyltransferase
VAHRERVTRGAGAARGARVRKREGAVTKPANLRAQVSKSGVWRPRFDVLELCLIVGLTSLLTVGLVQRFAPMQFPSIGFVHPEDRDVAKALARTYGPGHHSGGPEEWIVREVFKDRREGVFADVGAWQAVVGSNTYYLEHALGWSGLAVDALPTYAADWERLRRRSRFIQAFVDRTDGQPRKLYVSDEADYVSSSDRTFVSMFSRPTRTVEVTSATLDRLLERAQISRLDFLSMDIELSEPAGLAGFSIARYQPRLVCVEAHPPVRQDILKYFAAHGYVLVGRYLPVDANNLYFEPLTIASR